MNLVRGVLVCGGWLLVGYAGAAEPALYAWRGDVDGLFSYTKSEYVSRRFTLSADVAYPMEGRSLEGEGRFDREYVKEENSPVSVNKDEYDTSLKFKQYFDDSPYYAYVSPRARHNRNGYYQSAQALRVGLGRKIDGESWQTSVEMGSGYRVAHTDEGEDVSETLYTVTLKASWQLNETTTLKFNGVQEQSRRETFRTMSLALRHKLSSNLGVKYELFYKRSYPFDALERDGELSSEFGITYAF